MGYFNGMLKNIPGIVDGLTLDFSSNITVITGKNNVGKTRILESFAFLNGFNQNESALNYPCVSFELEMSGKKYAFVRNDETDDFLKMYDGTTGKEARLEYDELNHSAQFHYFNGGGLQGSLSSRSIIEGSKDQGSNEFRAFIEKLKGITYVADQRVINDTVQTDPEELPLPDGSNLGNVIYEHSSNRSSKYFELAGIMNNVFPEIEDVYTVPKGKGHVSIVVKDRYTGERIPLNDCGRGVSQVLHLVSLIIFSSPGKIFLIDEPHVFLHPGAEKFLAEFLKEHAEHKYIVATHSPIFVKAVQPDRIYIVRRDEKGTTMDESFSGINDRNILFDELGLDLGDMALAERIIFVEGDTDVGIYNSLLERSGYPASKYNYKIMGMGGGDISNQLENVLNGLSSITHLPYLIYLDGDKKFNGRIPEALKSKVDYLPTVDVESLLLKDLDAVVKVFRDICREKGINEEKINPYLTEVDEFIKKRRNEVPNLKGDKLLYDLFYQLSDNAGIGVYYNKNYGKLIAEVIDLKHVEHVTDTLKEFIIS